MSCPLPDRGGRQGLCTGPGRPRGFDVDDALAAALALFWRQGYEHTSLDELTRAMGISRSSFYACFKSKHEALLAAISRYCDDSFEALAGVAAAEADPCAAAHAVVAAIAAPGGGRRGCFLANCVTELAPHDPEVDALGRRQLERIEALLADLLTRAGRPALPGDDPEGRAAALLSLALGATMLRKAGTAPERIEALLAQADRLISP